MTGRGFATAATLLALALVVAAAVAIGSLRAISAAPTIDVAVPASAVRRAGDRVIGPVGLRQFDVPLACVWKDVGVLA
jgi:hypothetical protein